MLTWNYYDDTIGAYDDEEAAAHAYDLAALKYWGQDTILNFPVYILLLLQFLLQIVFCNSIKYMDIQFCSSPHIKKSLKIWKASRKKSILDP